MTDDTERAHHAHDDESSETTGERPPVKIERQVRFGTSGEFVVDTDPVAATLVDYGVAVGPERSSRLASSGSDAFVDDRTRSAAEQAGDQAVLIADVAADQQTLNGEAAALRWLFDPSDAETGHSGSDSSEPTTSTTQVEDTDVDHDDTEGESQ